MSKPRTDEAFFVGHKNVCSAMSLPVSRIIYYVRDVALLKNFYGTHFGLAVTEEIEGEWVVLQAGAIELALHRAGAPFRGAARNGGATSNVKLVFSVSDLHGLRERLLEAGVAMRGLKRYDGFPYVLCDGCDPEGNVFQLSQADDGTKNNALDYAGTIV